MRKISTARPGGYDALELIEAPDPTPGPGEVLVRVEAAGVNFADSAVRKGLYASAKEYVGWPITPGFEAAGTVAAVGEGVTDLAVAAPVVAVTRFGAYATHIVVPRRQVFARPAGFEAAEAAAGFPAVFLTAYYALVVLAAPRPGARILVHSAAGGVGSALLQIAKILGCRAVGVVGGAHKVEAARKLGAEVVIDKSSEDLWRAAERVAPEGYDAVLDANGVETLQASYDHLAPTGRLVVYGFATMLSKGRGTTNWLKLAWGYLRTPRFNPLDMTNRNRSVMAFNLSYLFERADVLAEAWAKLAAWCAEGRLAPMKVTTYPLERAGEAQRDIETGRTVGKLVLTTS